MLEIIPDIINILWRNFGNNLVDIGAVSKKSSQAVDDIFWIHFGNDLINTSTVIKESS
jgi:hypothetical protein